MSPAFYHIAHLVGLILLFVGFGALASGNRKGMMYHGIGLLILLIAGFGMIAKIKQGMPSMSYTEPWLIAKYAIFLILGLVLPVLAKRKMLPANAVLWIAILLGGCAAYLGKMQGAAFLFLKAAGS
ncbi:hypothetical protein DES53_10692 [Roseimicrobium gellanilyticum]|uniref:Uncharacterized protein n=1 Tax=Roseimicrobium gellanilyticum TaxID=748857 RepID=A0A366HI09_9BACT|nr:hypothetical protein [Roseimicrobium gellanilyticum]RBP42386.1 hypothetical protein DES53_10692 [Roseimicrobium gellanilyticum]